MQIFNKPYTPTTKESKPEDNNGVYANTGWLVGDSIARLTLNLN